MLLTCDKYSLFCLVETYLNLSDVSALLLFNCKGYTLFRLDRNIHAGGVLIICKNYLNPIRIFYSTHLNIEYICLDIDFSNTQKTRIICIYRPPSTDIANHQGICDLISYLCNIHYPSILLGDFNLPLINWDTVSCPNYSMSNNKFIECITENSLLQYITFPTRLNNILDLLFTNDSLLLSNISKEPKFGINKHISDHFSFSFNILSMSTHSVNPILPNFKKANFILMYSLLKNTQWENILSYGKDIDETINIFYSTMLDIFSKTVPMSKLSTNAHKYPKYIHSIQSKCLRNFKNRNKSTIHNNKWRDSQSLLHSNIQNYVLQREYKVINSNNKSLFYKYVNSRLSFHNGISPLIKDDNSYASLDYDKAVLLNDQFTSVFTNDNGIIPEHTLKTENTINDIIFTREMVRICLCKLSKSCTIPPDEIPSYILQKFSYDLALPLSIIFNKSIENGLCPIKWKYSFITPIFKKGDPSRRENYRPISITSIISRVFERLITKHIKLFLLKNSLLSKHQFGFMSGKSVELQLLACLNKWTSAINDNKYIDIVYFDFKKAFDKVSHIKLLIKLKDIGIAGNILKWIEVFQIQKCTIRCAPRFSYWTFTFHNFY